MPNKGPNETAVSTYLKKKKIDSNIVIYQFTTKMSALGAFAKLSKATMSVRPSVRMEQLGYRWKDFHEI